MAISRIQLPIKATLAEAWKKTHGAKGAILTAFACILAIMFVYGFIQGFIAALVPDPGVKAALSEIGQAIGFFFQMGIIYIGIQRAYDSPISVRMVFRAFTGDFIIKIIGLYLIQMLIIVGLIFAAVYTTMVSSHFLTTDNIVAFNYFAFAVAGIFIIFFSVRLGLAMGFVIHQDMNPIKALERSFQATRGNFWRITLLFIINAIILVLAFIPLGLGLIWALPFSCILYGVAYRILSATTPTQ
ncbi:MAG TPA: hypothetical protein VNC84_07215 [Gammaproteobacteria bacterium]|nr:hypothetical protein [Gammaproteobacteria bacterium]